MWRCCGRSSPPWPVVTGRCRTWTRCADRAAGILLGLGRVPAARRTGEWLSRLETGDVKGLWNAAVAFARRVAPSIIAHEVATRGYVPLFIDATGGEVDGHLFERTGKDYNGNRATGCTGRSWARESPSGPPPPGPGCNSRRSPERTGCPPTTASRGCLIV